MDLYIERDGIFKFGINKREGYVVCFFDKVAIENLEKIFMGMRLSVDPPPFSGSITTKQWEDAMGHDKTWHQTFIEEGDETEIKINSMIRDIIGVQSANFYKISQFSGRAPINKDTNVEVAKELAKVKLLNEYIISVTHAIKRRVECYYPEVVSTTESKVTTIDK